MEGPDRNIHLLLRGLRWQGRGLWRLTNLHHPRLRQRADQTTRLSPRGLRQSEEEEGRQTEKRGTAGVKNQNQTTNDKNRSHQSTECSKKVNLLFSPRRCEE
ncbi:hypothetical protein E2C01_037960 [Portunus trituberculatus]|uniref:Uncharacterized protein n=1 Tax=Portunus trituberculatus TaxID=210409 RepID=A0A5B7FGC4_PORTR|nr:hypothetical protein [Portunus trituberculatus]